MKSRQSCFPFAAAMHERPAHVWDLFSRRHASDVVLPTEADWPSFSVPRHVPSTSLSRSSARLRGQHGCVGWLGLIRGIWRNLFRRRLEKQRHRTDAVFALAFLARYSSLARFDAGKAAVWSGGSGCAPRVCIFSALLGPSRSTPQRSVHAVMSPIARKRCH